MVECLCAFAHQPLYFDYWRASETIHRISVIFCGTLICRVTVGFQTLLIYFKWMVSIFLSCHRLNGSLSIASLNPQVSFAVLCHSFTPFLTRFDVAARSVPVFVVTSSSPNKWSTWISEVSCVFVAQLSDLWCLTSLEFLLHFFLSSSEMQQVNHVVLDVRQEGAKVSSSVSDQHVDAIQLVIRNSWKPRSCSSSVNQTLFGSCLGHRGRSGNSIGIVCTSQLMTFIQVDLDLES